MIMLIQWFTSQGDSGGPFTVKNSTIMIITTILIVNSIIIVNTITIIIIINHDHHNNPQGDSGGPFTVKNSGTNQHDLVGVVSWGDGCAAVRISSSLLSWWYDGGDDYDDNGCRTGCTECMQRWQNWELGLIQRFQPTEEQHFVLHRNNMKIIKC